MIWILDCRFLREAFGKIQRFGKRTKSALACDGGKVAGRELRLAGNDGACGIIKDEAEFIEVPLSQIEGLRGL